MALEGVARGVEKQELDMGGSAIAYNDMDLYHNEVDEAGNSPIGRISASALADAAISAASGSTATITVSTGTPFSASSKGDKLLIENAANSVNNGPWLITAFSSTTVVTALKVDGATVVNESGVDWYYGKPSSLEDDLNCVRTDRKLMKGVPGADGHQAPIPDYQRPSAVGTDVPANLYNLSGTPVAGDWPAHTYGVTMDAKAKICDLASLAAAMSPAIAVNAASSTTSAGSVLTHGASLWLSSHVGRVVALTTAGADNGDWYIESYTSAADVVVKKLSDGSSLTTTLSGTVTITMYGDRRVVSTSTNYADSTDVTGLPVFDGYDATNYDSTYAFVLDAVEKNEFVSSDDKPVFGRLYGANEGVNVLVRFLKGNANDVTAVAHTWESDDPTSVDMYLPNRMRYDEIPEHCGRKVMAAGLMSDAELVNDISEIRTALGVADGETALVYTNTANYYPLAGIATDAEAAINALNNSVGDRQYNAFINSLSVSDGADITTVLNALAAEIDSSTIDRFVQFVSTPIAKFGDLLLSSFAGAPASYTKDGTHANNASLHVRGNLWHQGTVANNGQYEEGPDIGGGMANKFIVNSAINNDWVDVYIRM